MTLFPVISEFKGEYFFLSNFYPSPVVVWGVRWQTAEHAYQAAKTLLVAERVRINSCDTPGKAKRMGKSVTLREDWEENKLSIMEQVVSAKFEQNSKLRTQLIATAGTYLEEGNTWKDTFWGICPPGSGKGQNHLGKILMNLRERELEWLSNQ